MIISLHTLITCLGTACPFKACFGRLRPAHSSRGACEGVATDPQIAKVLDLGLHC